MQFFYFLFLISIYKMVDSMDIYTPLNINVETVMKNPVMLIFFLIILKLKKRVRKQVSLESKSEYTVFFWKLFVISSD